MISLSRDGEIGLEVSKSAQHVFLLGRMFYRRRQDALGVRRLRGFRGIHQNGVRTPAQERGNAGMLYYRFYLLDAAGHIREREESYCADEAEARARARELCKFHDIEIWQGTTKVGVFDCETLRASRPEDAAAGVSI